MDISRSGTDQSTFIKPGFHMIVAVGRHIGDVSQISRRHDPDLSAMSLGANLPNYVAALNAAVWRVMHYRIDLFELAT